MPLPYGSEKRGVPDWKEASYASSNPPEPLPKPKAPLRGADDLRAVQQGPPLWLSQQGIPCGKNVPKYKATHCDFGVNALICAPGA